MKSYNIAVMGGDGTGPEVIREAVKVLEVAAKKFKLKLNYTNYDLGGERYLRTGETLPDSVIAELRKFPAILLGAIGHPDVKPGILEKGILLRARFELEQYINLRPVKLYDERFCPLKDKKPEHIDFVVVRENNEGLYTGTGGSGRLVPPFSGTISITEGLAEPRLHRRAEAYLPGTHTVATSSANRMALVTALSPAYSDM